MDWREQHRESEEQQQARLAKHRAILETFLKAFLDI